MTTQNIEISRAGKDRLDTIRKFSMNQYRAINKGSSMKNSPENRARFIRALVCSRLASQPVPVILSALRSIEDQIKNGTSAATALESINKVS